MKRKKHEEIKLYLEGLYFTNTQSDFGWCSTKGGGQVYRKYHVRDHGAIYACMKNTFSSIYP